MTTPPGISDNEPPFDKWGEHQDDEFHYPFSPPEKDHLEFKIESKIPPAYQVRFVQAQVQARAGNYQTALHILQEIEKDAQPPFNPDVPDFASHIAIQRRVDSLRDEWKKLNKKTKPNFLLVTIESVFLLLSVLVTLYVLFAEKTSPPSPWHRGFLGQTITILSFILGGVPVFFLFITQGNAAGYLWLLLNTRFSKKNMAEKVFEILLIINGMLFISLLLKILLK